MALRRRAAAWTGLVAAAVLAGCAELMPPPEPDPAPAPAPVAEPEPEPVPRPDLSLALELYYARLQNDLLEQGLMRGDGGGVDTPFTDTMLARDFVRVALYDEYVDDGSSVRPEARISRLRRWEGRVNFAVEFGPTIPEAQAARDRASVSAYVARLARVTGHPMGMTGAPNFTVMFLNEDERLALGPQLRALVPGIADSSVRAIETLPRSTLCVVVAFSEPGGYAYTNAVAIIRGEHPDLMRLACIHEELAQGLGLANDDPQSRPSIFNDDEEFALLTGHDELLLRMLYDPRLRTGMTAAEAAPVVREIAAEVMGGV